MFEKTVLAWQNGTWIDSDSVAISIRDLGLLRAWGVYDVISVKNQRALSLSQHLQRFFDGCNYYHITVPYEYQDFIDIISKFWQRHQQDLQVWFIATRGSPHAFDLESVLNTEAEFIALVSPYQAVNNGNDLHLGIPRTVRRIPDICVNQCYKNFARQDFTISQIEIAKRNLHYPLLLDHNDLVTEGPHFSVAIVKKSKVIAPRKNCLPGVTMRLVKSLCDDHGIAFEYDNITEQDLYDADDMFATSTSGGILSIQSVEHKKFTKSDIQHRIKQLYQLAWNQDQYSTLIL